MKEWVMDYLATLGLSGLLVGMVIESLGIPFPGGIMVIVAGFLVNQGKFNLYHTLAAVMLGFNSGALIAYLIGRYIGEPFLLRYGRLLKVTPQRLDRAQEWLEQSAAAFIMAGRFVPMISNLTPYMAGISGLSIFKFLIYNLIFTFLWSSLNLSLGIFLGHKWGTLLHFIHSRLYLVGGGILILCLVILYIRRRAPQKI